MLYDKLYHHTLDVQKILIKINQKYLPCNQFFARTMGQRSKKSYNLRFIKNKLKIAQLGKTTKGTLLMSRKMTQSVTFVTNKLFVGQSQGYNFGQKFLGYQQRDAATKTYENAALRTLKSCNFVHMIPARKC